MEFYLFCLCLSFAGLVLMALSGLGHHHAGHGHVRAVGKGLRGRHGAGPHHGGHFRPATFLLGLFSPRWIFTVLLGFSATGLILCARLHFSSKEAASLAIVGGLAFEQFIGGPIWRLLFGFASKPACTLESAALGAGHAATDFDRGGHGLVLLELDGQVRQVLGTLTLEERGPGTPRVRTGDALFIRSVDRRRNVCTVSRLGC
ncbi:MAG: hypothetical protein INR65_05695 [Gluconacetobacter diazotrophicus]|nr:hypothetical protein [Gluconacetobacter diazotrophicus]